MTDPIPARLAALKTMALPDLKAEWRDALRRRAAAATTAASSRAGSPTASRSSPTAG